MKRKFCLKTMRDGKIISEKIEAAVENEYDIIVAGLGTAGSICAICSAEKKLNVLGIERLSGMGGIGTFGCIWPYFFGAPGGRFEQINKKARSFYKKGYTMAEPQDGIGEILYFWDPKGVSLGTDRYVPGPLKEYSLEDAFISAGGEVSLNSVICGVIFDNSVPCGVRYFKNGRCCDVFAKVIVDALGDAYITKISGSPTDHGRKSDGAVMNFVKGYGRREKDLIRGYFWSTGLNRKLDTYELSAEHLRTIAGMSMKASEDCRIVCESAMPTLREVPHISGMNRLTLKSYAEDKTTDEPLFYMHAPLDNTNADVGFESELLQDWSFLCGMDGKYAISCAVPMKLLFPVDINSNVIENIVTIGRGMSIDHDICGSFRMKKDYEKLGEAAAAVCVNAVENGIPPHKVNYLDIKPVISESGCLDPAGNRPVTEFLAKDGKYNKEVRLPETENEIIRTLESERPYPAYWAMCKTGKYHLTEKMIARACEEGKYRKHYALAAGLAGNTAVIDTLLLLIDNDIKAKRINSDTIRFFVLAARLKSSDLISRALPIAEYITDIYFRKRLMRMVDLRMWFSLLVTSLHSLNTVDHQGVSNAENDIFLLLNEFSDDNASFMLRGYIKKLKGEQNADNIQ